MARSRRSSIRTLALASAFAVVVALAFRGGDAAQAAPLRFTIQLTGAQVVPPVTTAAIGFAQLVFEPETRDLSYSFVLFGLAPKDVTGMELHRGAIGATGDLVQTLSSGGSTQGVGLATLAVADAADFMRGLLYIDVRTRAYPEGVVRGQVLVPGAPNPTPTPTPTPTPVPTSTPVPPTPEPVDQPALAPATGFRGVITPPNTGDAGLR